MTVMTDCRPSGLTPLLPRRPDCGEYCAAAANARRSSTGTSSHRIRGIGTDSYDVEVRELPPNERDTAFNQIAKAAPGFGDYQTKTSRLIPVFELRKV
jgi:hypothetical protein